MLRFRHGGAHYVDPCAPAELAVPHVLYGSVARVDIAAELCSVPALMRHMDQPPVLTLPSAVRRHVSGVEARLDQPTNTMPESAVAAEATKPSIPANARPHRAVFQSVPSRWARVEFDSVDGTYEVQARIPAQWATAHVQYLIWADENGDSTFARDEYLAGPWLNQQTNNKGRQSLGVHALRGRVQIQVRETQDRDDRRDVGLANASIAVDAIRLRDARSQ